MYQSGGVNQESSLTALAGNQPCEESLLVLIFLVYILKEFSIWKC